MDTKEHFIFWISKLAYIGVFIVVPIFRIGLIETIIAYLLISFVCGFIIAVVFQLAHIVEDAKFSTPNSQTFKIEE